jgi:hypothetical protein
VNQVLRAFQRDGAVDLSYGRIDVLDPAVLEGRG